MSVASREGNSGYSGDEEVVRQEIVGGEGGQEVAAGMFNITMMLVISGKWEFAGAKQGREI